MISLKIVKEPQKKFTEINGGYGRIAAILQLSDPKAGASFNYANPLCSKTQ
jgi:hypothetical protein